MPLLPTRALEKVRSLSISVPGTATKVGMAVQGFVRHDEARVDFLGPGDERISVGEHGEVHATNLRAFKDSHGPGAAVKVCGAATCSEEQATCLVCPWQHTRSQARDPVRRVVQAPQKTFFDVMFLFSMFNVLS